ncbi:MAG: HAD-IIA family hydrolase [Ignavibacteriae bacterium]|nr:HAD-IIA family hydrolase [Ignavibacteriota bacterium]
MNFVEKYDGFIFDLDGTIYLEDKIIPNAVKVINKLKSLNKKIVFISNKTTGSIEDYYSFLFSHGFKINKNQFLTATVITKKYLANKYYGKKFFAIAEKKFIMEIESAGLEYCENANKIDLIIVTLDRTLNYQKLEIAGKALDNGAKFFAANIDNTCPINGGEILDAGSTISALEKRTNKKLQKHFGKPSRYMFNEIMNLINLHPQKCLIIGDRLETDIAMGNKFGVDTALVQTGVSKDIVHLSKNHPTYTINSINNLL